MTTTSRRKENPFKVYEAFLDLLKMAGEILGLNYLGQPWHHERAQIVNTRYKHRNKRTIIVQTIEGEVGIPVSRRTYTLLRRGDFVIVRYQEARFVSPACLREYRRGRLAYP